MSDINDLSGVYNVACEGSITIQELAEKIVVLTGSQSQICFAPERAGDIKHSRASVDKIQRCGYKAATSFEQGLCKTIQIHRLREP